VFRPQGPCLVQSTSAASSTLCVQSSSLSSGSSIPRRLEDAVDAMDALDIFRVGCGRRWLTARLELDGARYQSAIGVWPGTGKGDSGSTGSASAAGPRFCSSGDSSGLSSIPRASRREDDSMGVSRTGGRYKLLLPSGAVTAVTGVDSDVSDAAFDGCR